MSITIKQAFEKLAMVTGAALKNPWFIGRNLSQAFNDIAANIEAGGGGSTVEVTQVLESGTKIATITVDEESTDLYAPSQLHIYSTTEKVVGKWIDGETDVYERTIVYETPLALTYDTWVDTGLTSADNIATVIEVSAAGNNKGNVSSIECIPGADSKYLPVMLCANLSNRDIKYLTLKYLKSTT